MRTARAFALVAAIVSVGACASKQPPPPTPPADPQPSAAAETEAQLIEVRAALTDVTTKLVDTQAQLDAVLTQLERVERKVDEAAVPPPPVVAKAKPTFNRPDPHATYRVEVGDARTRGRATALVTIVQWTDYQ
ncbi:MAG: hypothetical protein AAF721_38510 [Myxococcota bacterium]